MSLIPNSAEQSHGVRSGNVDQTSQFHHQSPNIGIAIAKEGGKIENIVNINGSTARPRGHFVRAYSTRFLHHFTDKNGEFEAIKRTLELTADDRNPPGCAIWGMTGIGKTWLAHKYLQDTSQEFCKIFLKASDMETLQIDVNQALMQMGYDRADDDSIDSAIRTFKSRLEEECAKEYTCKGWLLILDDVRDETKTKSWDLIQVKGGQGRDLITTRSRPIAEGLMHLLYGSHVRRCHEILLPNPGWAAELFCKLSNIPHEGEQMNAIYDIVKAVGYLPLALEIAAIKAREEGIESVWNKRHDAVNWGNPASNYEFHRRFQDNKILKNAFDFLWDFKHRSSQVEEVLFGELSVLDHSHISIELLKQRRSEQRNWWWAKLNPLQIQEEQQIEDVVRRLEELLLLTRGSAGGRAFVWIHSLVQVISREEIYNGETYKNIEAAVNRLEIALKYGKENQSQGSIIQVDEIRRHIQAITHCIKSLKKPRHGLRKQQLNLLNFQEAIVETLLDQGKYKTARDVAENTLELRLRLQSANDIDYLRCLNIYATTLHRLGNYKAAEEHSKKALDCLDREIEKMKLTSRTRAHEELLFEWLACKETYAVVRCYQGEYADSLGHMQYVARAKEQLWSTGHIEILRSYRYLAVIHRYCGEYEKAQKFGELAHHGMEKLLGEKHLETLEILNCYALTLQKQGKYDKAEGLIEKVLRQRKRSLGAEHPSTLESWNNYALVLRDQGKYVDAEKHARHALDFRQKVIGNEHPDVWVSQSTLAHIYLCQGKYKEARVEAQSAFARQEKILGKDHPDTITTLCTLASITYHLGSFIEADRIYQDVCRARKRTLPGDHPDFLHVHSIRTCVYALLGDYSKAEERYTRIHNRQHAVLGEMHPNTLSSLNALAFERFRLGQYADAAETACIAWTGLEETVGPEHPLTLESLHNYAIILRHQGLYQEAEDLSKWVYEWRLEELKADHPNTLASLDSYAMARFHTGHFQEAKDLCLDVLKRRLRVLGNDHPDTQESLDNHVLLSISCKEDASLPIYQSLEWKSHLPENHPSKLLSRYNYIAGLLEEQDYEQAEVESMDVLVRRGHVLGDNHPQTIASKHQLGWIYGEVGKYQMAVEMLSEAWECRKKILGEHHPDTLSSFDQYRLADSRFRENGLFVEVPNMETSGQAEKISKKPIKRIVSRALVRRNSQVISKSLRERALKRLVGPNSKGRDEVTFFYIEGPDAAAELSTR